MVSHVSVPINVYALYQRACEFLLQNEFCSVIDTLKELNAFNPNDFDRSKHVLVGIDDWQTVFNAGVACWMGQEVISRLTLAQTLETKGRTLH